MPKPRRLGPSSSAGPVSTWSAGDSLLLHLFRPELFAPRTGVVSVAPASLPSLQTLGALHGQRLARGAHDARAPRRACDRPRRLRAQRHGAPRGQANPNADRILFHLFAFVASVHPRQSPRCGSHHVPRCRSIFLRRSHAGLRRARRPLHWDHRASVSREPPRAGAVRDLQRGLAELPTQCASTRLLALVARALSQVVLRSIRRRALRRSEVSRRLARAISGRRRLATQGRQSGPLESGEIHAVDAWRRCHGRWTAAHLLPFSPAQAHRGMDLRSSLDGLQDKGVLRRPAPDLRTVHPQACRNYTVCAVLTSERRAWERYPLYRGGIA